MDDYPSEYVEHNLPLVLLSGLGVAQDQSSRGLPIPRHASGSKITIQAPECRGERPSQLLQHLLAWDGTEQPWNAASQPPPGGTLKYKLKAIGRVGTSPFAKSHALIEC